MRCFSYAGIIALSVGSIVSVARGADNAQVAAAGKQVHSASAAADSARAEINQIRVRVRAKLSAQPEWSGAIADLRTGALAQAQERRDVLAALAKNPAYLSLSRQREQAQAALSGASDNQADASKVQNAGDVMIQRSFEIKRLEDAALNEDSSYKAAKAKVDQLRAKVDQLDSQVELAMKDDPAYEPATTRLKAAEQQLTAARQQLAAALQADRDARAAKLKADQQDGSGY